MDGLTHVSPSGVPIVCFVAIAASHPLPQQDYESAMKKGLEALELIRGNDKRAEAALLECLVSWSITQEKPHKALVMAKEALALRLELEAPPLEEARACLLLVEALAGVKKVRRGLKAAEECLNRLKKVSDRANVYGSGALGGADSASVSTQLAPTEEEGLQQLCVGVGKTGSKNSFG
eukprot:Skav212128  [mRNA]  locus=scaffold1323:31753:36649:+ [translate_table: standard]